MKFAGHHVAAESRVGIHMVHHMYATCCLTCAITVKCRREGLQQLCLSRDTSTRLTLLFVHVQFLRILCWLLSSADAHVAVQAGLSRALVAAFSMASMASAIDVWDPLHTQTSCTTLLQGCFVDVQGAQALLCTLSESLIKRFRERYHFFSQDCSAWMPQERHHTSQEGLLQCNRFIPALCLFQTWTPLSKIQHSAHTNRMWV